MIYQLIYIALLILSLGMNFSKHGEPKTGKYNGCASILSLSITLFLLYKAGFFNNLINLM